MDFFIEFGVQFGVAAVLILVGFVAGRTKERRHYRSILKRETALDDILVFSSRDLGSTGAEKNPTMVMGNAVIAQDYFKGFLGALRNIVGGRMASYESLLDRARREAVLRMKEQARTAGSDFVFNVKFETARISTGGGLATTVEVLAYGTAVSKGPGI